VPGKYTYTDQVKRGYFAWVDADTGRMLIAEPGESYNIRAVEDWAEVPPPDGRWVPVTAGKKAAAGGGE
jgi:hypothetical protein